MWIEIPNVQVGDEVIKLKRPFVFFIYKKQSLYYINDDFVWIHETAKSIEELTYKIGRTLTIQWEDIAMEDNKKLNRDAQFLKEYMLSHVM